MSAEDYAVLNVGDTVHFKYDSSREYKVLHTFEAYDSLWAVLDAPITKEPSVRRVDKLVKVTKWVEGATYKGVSSNRPFICTNVDANGEATVAWVNDNGVLKTGRGGRVSAYVRS